MPLFVAQDVIDTLTRQRDAAIQDRDEARRELAREKSLRTSDASLAADAVQIMRAKLAASEASANSLNERLTQEQEHNSADVRETYEKHTKALRDLQAGLVAAQEALRASRAVFDAEATQHAQTRAERDSALQAHAQAVSQHGVILAEHAALKKQHGELHARTAAAENRADLEVAAARDLIDRLTTTRSN